jgi:hypothetical protein
MEFSEISEIDEIITYSKTLKSTFIPKPARNMQIDDDFFPQQNYIPYDEVMNTSGSLDTEAGINYKKGDPKIDNFLNNAINLNYPLNQETMEILTDISNSLTLIPIVGEDEIKLENNSENGHSSKNGLHKLCFYST